VHVTFNRDTLVTNPMWRSRIVQALVARDNMSNYKVPRAVRVLDALPVNVNGKVDKRALRALIG
jgi:acyl-CoA synthetase (AMP-forming)/AMP-acid ligase II